MKIKFAILLSATIFGFIFLLGSCIDDDTVTQSVSPTLEIQMRVGSETLNEGNIYTINGTTIQIDVARFYLGAINFDGSTDYTQDDYLLVGGNNTSFNLDFVDEGTYNLSFAVGIDSTVNSQTTEDFTTRAAGDPLGLQEPAMHWNWNSGYKFLRIDGQVDTDADNVVDTAVQYHIGSNAFYSVINVIEQISLAPLNEDITLRFDVEALLNNIDLSTGASTHVGDNKPMADQIFENYSSAFSIIN